MATVIGVRFKKAGKVYYFDPGKLWPKPGEFVVVETTRGIEMGEVITGARTVSDAQIIAPLKQVIRSATPEDIQRSETNEKREKEAFELCQQKIAKHKLEMKLISVEYTFDGSKIIFYFTANGRVDFRDLVKDLAGVFKMRIELRQIGVRDEAKMLGGLGACGRSLCCDTFLSDFQPVSIRMAKDQNLSLNPTKISGQCGRLMCCLKYEQDTYEQTLKRVPRVGKDIVTPDGIGVICEINAIKESLKVRIQTDDGNFEMRDYSIDDCRRPDAADGSAVREVPKAKHPEPEEKPGEDTKKKSYPRQKAPKNLSTDQFLEKMNDTASSEGGTPSPSAPKEHKPRKRSPKPKAGAPAQEQSVGKTVEKPAEPAQE